MLWLSGLFYNVVRAIPGSPGLIVRDLCPALQNKTYFNYGAWTITGPIA